MYYANIKNCDIANGTGVRISLFVSGCTHHCEGCFQPETWSFTYGQPYTPETENMLIKMLGPAYIDGLSLLGGEPMEPENQRALLPLLRRVRREYPEKNIWCYTGYTLETDLLNPELTRRHITGRARCESTDEMLSLIDVLVDGEFVQEKKNISLVFRGSENQRIIDLKKTLSTGKTTLFDV